MDCFANICLPRLCMYQINSLFLSAPIIYDFFSLFVRVSLLKQIENITYESDYDITSCLSSNYWLLKNVLINDSARHMWIINYYNTFCVNFGELFVLLVLTLSHSEGQLILIMMTSSIYGAQKKLLIEV